MWPFFRKNREFERALHETYVPMISVQLGISDDEARSMFKDLLATARRDANRERTLNLPLDAGDRFLAGEAVDRNVCKILDWKRLEGVRDEDIRNWWNRHDLERRLMLGMDDVFKLASYMFKTEQEGYSHEAAIQNVKKHYPIFGEPTDRSDQHPEDGPLPPELKLRVTDYMLQNVQTMDQVKMMKERLESFSSVNAFVRAEIRAGRL